MTDTITPETLAQNIREFMAQGAALEEIKADALAQGIDQNLWDQAEALVTPQNQSSGDSLGPNPIPPTPGSVPVTPQELGSLSNAPLDQVPPTAPVMASPPEAQDVVPAAIPTPTPVAPLPENSSPQTTPQPPVPAPEPVSIPAMPEANSTDAIAPPEVQTPTADSPEGSLNEQPASETQPAPTKEAKPKAPPLPPEEQKKRKIFLIAMGITGGIILLAFIVTIIV